jgi:hypothetical protein
MSDELLPITDLLLKGVGADLGTCPVKPQLRWPPATAAGALGPSPGQARQQPVTGAVHAAKLAPAADRPDAPADHWQALGRSSPDQTAG